MDIKIFSLGEDRARDEMSFDSASALIPAEERRTEAFPETIDPLQTGLAKPAQVGVERLKLGVVPAWRRRAGCRLLLAAGCAVAFFHLPVQRLQTGIRRLHDVDVQKAAAGHQPAGNVPVEALL